MSALFSLFARACRCATIAAAISAAAAVTASAQGGAKSVPNALQGFAQNRGQAVRIEATSLEVRDKQKMATFTGNVKVVQGDTTLRCKSLVVFYDAEKTPGAMRVASPGPGGAQQIRRLEARGGVTVTQKDQTATGDAGIFDMQTNTVTLIGNVVVSQGPNVMRGDRVVADLTTGVSRVDASKSHGPVQMLYQPESQGTPSSSAPKRRLPHPLSSN